MRCSRFSFVTYSSFDGDCQQRPHLSQHGTQVRSNTGQHVRLARLTTRKLSGLQTIQLMPVVTGKGNNAMRRRPLSRIDGMSIDYRLLILLWSVVDDAIFTDVTIPTLLR